jgi:hypothetical protein
MTDTFITTLNDLARSADRPQRFSAAFVEVLPVNGASVSTVGDVLGSETVSATDDVAAHLDELQFDLGEGPCWDAVRSARAVIEPDFVGGGASRWPTLAAAARPTPIASVFAFPLVVGALRFGAVDLYSRSLVVLDATQEEQATAMADVVGRHVLREALTVGGADHGLGAKPYSRRTVHQAAGVLLAQLDLAPEDAMLMIQAHAFGAGQSMIEVSGGIIDGTLRFIRTERGIEVST